VSATTVMLIAFGALILAHWANSEPTITVPVLIEIVFAVLFISFLESIPSAQPVASGLAWIFLAAVLLSNGSILGALGKAESTPASKTTTTTKKAAS
jgi:hypothetical protein